MLYRDKRVVNDGFLSTASVSDFNLVATLGVGGFGRVELVRIYTHTHTLTYPHIPSHIHSHTHASHNVTQSHVSRFRPAVLRKVKVKKSKVRLYYSAL